MFYYFVEKVHILYKRTPSRSGLVSKPMKQLMAAHFYYSVYVCGNWDMPSCPDYTPSEDLVEALESMASPLMYIGFGSMETLYSHIVNWKKAITNINAGLAVS